MFAPFLNSRVSSTKQNFACQNRAFSRSEAHKSELGLVFSSSWKISKQRIENVSAFIIKGSFWRRLQNWCFITSLLLPNPNTVWLCCTFTAHTHHIDRRDDFMCLVRHQQQLNSHSLKCWGTKTNRRMFMRSKLSSHIYLQDLHDDGAKWERFSFRCVCWELNIIWGDELGCVWFDFRFVAKSNEVHTRRWCRLTRWQACQWWRRGCPSHRHLLISNHMEQSGELSGRLFSVATTRGITKW